MNNFETVKEINRLVKNNPVKVKWLTIKEVQKLTTLSYSTIRRAVDKGVLVKSKRPGKILFHPDDVNKWLGK